MKKYYAIYESSPVNHKQFNLIQVFTPNEKLANMAADGKNIEMRRAGRDKDGAAGFCIQVVYVDDNQNVFLKRFIDPINKPGEFEYRDVRTEFEVLHEVEWFGTPDEAEEVCDE